MPEIINSALVDKKNQMHNFAPFVWLFELDLDGTNAMRICGYDASLSWGGHVWSPFPIKIGILPRDAEANLPIIDATISNISREIGSYLDADGVVDRIWTLRLVNTEHLTVAIPWGEWTVQDAQLQLPHAVIRLGQYALIDAPLPARVQNRSRCDNIYGADECGYPLAIANFIAGTNPLFDPTKCDLTLDGSNGCIVHGLNEQAAGKPKLHPKRWGAHPGIPKGPAR